MPAHVKLGTPGEIAAAVPSLIGFVPGDGSIVVITIKGKRLGLTMRVDYPGAGVAVADVLAARLVQAIDRSEPDTTSVHVVGWNTATGDVDEIAFGLMRQLPDRVSVDEIITVQQREGEWQYLDTCQHVMPEVERTWQPLPEDRVRPVGIAELGAVVQPSREAIKARFVADASAPSLDPTDALTALLIGGTDGRDDHVVVLARMEAARLLAEVDRYARIARVSTGETRDAALTLAAIAAYLAGDGATASIALDWVSPSYTLAHLVRAAYAAPVPPDVLRSMLIAADAA